MPTLVATGFPTNVIDVLANELAMALGAEVDKVLKRPLRPEDPHASVGIWAEEWVPQQAQIGQHDPAISLYTFGIQTFVKVAEETEGRRQHTYFAKRVREVLYRSPTLRLALGALNDTDVDSGMTERMLRWGVRRQRFATNEIDEQFMFAATTEFFIETETV